MLVTKQLTVAIDFHSMETDIMEVNGYRQLFSYLNSSKYLLLCLAEEINEYIFETTWGWANDLIFEWTTPLTWWIIGNQNYKHAFIASTSTSFLYLVISILIFQSKALIQQTPPASHYVCLWMSTVTLPHLPWYLNGKCYHHGYVQNKTWYYRSTFCEIW